MNAGNPNDKTLIVFAVLCREVWSNLPCMNNISTISSVSCSNPTSDGKASSVIIQMLCVMIYDTLLLSLTAKALERFGSVMMDIVVPTSAIGS